MIFTEERLAMAAEELNEAMLQNLPEPGECQAEFSEGFEKKMKRVIRRAERPALFRVAAVLLAVFLGLMALSPRVRAGFFGLVRQTYESFIYYEFRDPQVGGMENVRYRIAGLGEEYVLETGVHEGGSHHEVYVNSANETLHFRYVTDYNAHSMYIEVAGRVERVSINGEPGDVYIADAEEESNCIIWHVRDRGLMFFIMGRLDAEELVTLAESVERTEE